MTVLETTHGLVWKDWIHYIEYLLGDHALDGVIS